MKKEHKLSAKQRLKLKGTTTTRTNTYKEFELNLALNVIRKVFIRNLVKRVTTKAEVRKRYRDIKNGLYDEQIREEMEELTEKVIAKVKQRGYWPL